MTEVSGGLSLLVELVAGGKVSLEESDGELMKSWVLEARRSQCVDVDLSGRTFGNAWRSMMYCHRRSRLLLVCSKLMIDAFLRSTYAWQVWEWKSATWSVQGARLYR